MFEWILIAVLGTVVIGLLLRNKELNDTDNVIVDTKADNTNLEKELKELKRDLLDTEDELGQEREKNRVILSKKKSNEVRLGQISENLVPFLKNCPYDPSDMKFLAAPIDYLVFDYDAARVVFLEIKSGSSKASKRQKLIKNIIKTGRVYYEELRINEKGVKHKKFDNESDSK